MADKLKDMYRDEVIKKMALKFKKGHKDFDVGLFFDLVKKDDFESLELKQRQERLARSFYETLNLPFKETAIILQKINEDCTGFKYMFLPEVIAIYGINDIDTSLDTLEVLTSGSSSEFAIRTFLNLDYEKTFERIKKWSLSDNEHVRRLASEGIRTRLPWGKKVDELFNHPLEIIDILENLKEDPSLYVRKSVANNLNDLSKDFPFLTFKVLRNWKGKNEYTDWIVKKGARGLLKKGDAYVLNLFGYDDIKVKNIKFVLDKTEYVMGETLNLNYGFKTERESNLRVSLKFEFKNKTGYSKKIFKLTESNSKNISGKYHYNFKDLTTRKHYEGFQYLTLQVNGKDVKKLKIKLLMN